MIFGEIYENIHPIISRMLGHRLALWAAKPMEKRGAGYSGPVLHFPWRLKQENRSQIFNHSDDGLMKKGRSYTSFNIAGDESSTLPRKGQINGNTVWGVLPRKVKNPVAVRFAFYQWGITHSFQFQGAYQPALLERMIGSWNKKLKFNLEMNRIKVLFY